MTFALVLCVVSADVLVSVLIHTLDQLVSAIQMMTPVQEMLMVTNAAVRKSNTQIFLRNYIIIELHFLDYTSACSKNFCLYDEWMFCRII